MLNSNSNSYLRYILGHEWEGRKVQRGEVNLAINALPTTGNNNWTDNILAKAMNIK